ncbi:30S ribosomal protein S2 [Rickettsiales bacterium]|nr:30S ribosomal protein S2 [Rickettsiales bacterium]MDB2550505.1 30S ribosomal protein S2 [Rickettsiales bacterium]
MTENTIKLPKIKITQLLEAKAHVGHQSRKLNTKMAKYIFCDHNKTSIIDLNKTAQALFQSLQVVKNVAKNNGRILFVSTKKQASELTAQYATKCGQYYVNQKWLGGMLTNWKTISNSIKTLEKIEKDLSDENADLNKKEKLVLERDRLKLESALGGIRNMGGHPDLVVIIDIRRESNALNETKKLGIPVVAVVDTNCNPDPVDFVIPGNDDSRQSIELFYHLISSAILCGIEESAKESGMKNLEKTEVKTKKTSKTKEVKKEEINEVEAPKTEEEVKIEEIPAAISEEKKEEKPTKAKAATKTATKTKSKAKSKTKTKAE